MLEQRWSPQWRNSRGGGQGERGQSAPQTHREISADVLGKERQGKGKWRRKEGKSKKGRWKIENENGRRKSHKMRREPFFFFFFFFHFSKPLKFVSGLPIFFFFFFFFTEKKLFTPGKKSGKNDFAPFETYSCYAPGSSCGLRQSQTGRTGMLGPQTATDDIRDLPCWFMPTQA